MQKFPYSKVEVSFLCSISLNSVEFTSENDILFFFLLVLLVAKKRVRVSARLVDDMSIVIA